MKLNWNDAILIDAKLNDYRDEILKTHILYNEFKDITSYDLYKFVLHLLYDKYRDIIIEYKDALEFSESILRIYLILGELSGVKNTQIYYNDEELVFLFSVTKRIINIRLSIIQDSK